MYYYPFHQIPIQYIQPYHGLQYPSCNSYRQFPEVDTHQLEISAHRFQALMKQAHLLINKIANSTEFAHNLMTAAQKSDEKTVNELIRSTGITIKTKTTFTPTGIRIVLSNSEKPGDCCDLLIALRW